jgi:hypothetical protein
MTLLADLVAASVDRRHDVGSAEDRDPLTSLCL